MNLNSYAAAVLFIAGAIACSALIFNIAVTLLAWLFRIPIRVFSIGIGPIIFRVKLGDATLQVSPFLLSGFVSFGPKLIRGEVREFSEFSGLTRAIMALSGPIGVVLVAALVLGPAAISQSISAWREAYLAVTDFSAPLHLVLETQQLMRDAGLAAAFATILSKTAGVNLLPLPIFAGGQALIALLEYVSGKPLMRSLQPVLLLSLVTALAVAAIVMFREATGT